MTKWKPKSRRMESRMLLRHASFLREMYLTFVDDWPAQGTAQMLCELFRILDGGRPVGGLQGRATKTKASTADAQRAATAERQRAIDFRRRALAWFGPASFRRRALAWFGLGLGRGAVST